MRPVLALALLVGLYCLGRRSGLFDDFDAEKIRATVEDAGVWGYAAYIGLYIVGGIMQLPGALFIGAAVAIYGKLVGFFVALAGSFISVVVTFVMVRSVGGKALASIEHPLMKALLRRVDGRPVLSVIVMRVLFGISPPLNYALAMSNLRLRAYALGSLVGLVMPVLFWVFFFEVLTELLPDWLFG